MLISAFFVPIGVGGLYKKWSNLKYNDTFIFYAFGIYHVNVADCPQQTISSDCGVFMLKCIEYLSSGRTLDFTHADIQLIKEKYTIDVFYSQLSL